MYEKILAAVDESEVADRVLGAASGLAALSQGEVFVIHLREREPAKYGLTATETISDAQSVVDGAVQKLTAAGVKVTGAARDSVLGFAAKEIISEADSREAGVIVMGSRGRGDLAGLLLGSTAHKVIHLANRPVLVVR
jgi:nucleotide-binding universal stress UspA family protein